MKKKIIFDVGHPAQVHNFKHVYWELQAKGWEGLFTAKDKEVTVSLLKEYKLPYIIIGKTHKNIFLKILGLFCNLIIFSRILIRFKPLVVVCRFSPHACWSSKFLGIPLIGLADTEHTTFLDRFTVPLASAKLTAFSYQRDLGKNHFRYNANIELFYLHKNRFSPSRNHFNILGIDKDTKYAIVRFVSWSAHHDIGVNGMKDQQKEELVEFLKTRFRVFITSESVLPPKFEEFKLNVSPGMMHDVLASASLYVGEGASMASEAACLGVMSFYINKLTAGSIEEEKDYGLLYHYDESSQLLSDLKKVIDNPNLMNNTKYNRDSFMKGKIDVTAFLTWFIESFPRSISVMKNNPDFQNTFM